MKDLSYLLPCRIESDDRLRNVITSVSYLLKNFPEAKVLIKEVDTKSQFIEFALPQIKKYVGDIDQLKHSFEKSDEKFFHKTRILNDLCVAAETPIIYNHDVDVVLLVLRIIIPYSWEEPLIFRVIIRNACLLFVCK